jgi:hypothetical protein
MERADPSALKEENFLKVFLTVVKRGQICGSKEDQINDDYTTSARTSLQVTNHPQCPQPQVWMGLNYSTHNLKYYKRSLCFSFLQNHIISPI